MPYPTRTGTFTKSDVRSVQEMEHFLTEHEEVIPSDLYNDLREHFEAMDLDMERLKKEFKDIDYNYEILSEDYRELEKELIDLKAKQKKGAVTK